MWNTIVIAIGWLGCIICILSVSTFMVAKVWCCQLKPGYDFRGEWQKLQGLPCAVLGLVLIPIVMTIHYHQATAGLVVLMSCSLMWLSFIVSIVRRQSKVFLPLPDRDNDGVARWYYFCGRKWKIIHRSEARPLHWWEFGGYSPAIMTKRFETCTRLGLPVKLTVRYYGAETVNPRDFSSGVEADYKELKRYCLLLAKATRIYALSREPFYEHYLSDSLFGPDSALLRLMCSELRQSLTDQLPDL